MIKYYDLNPVETDYAQAVSAHSGDLTVAYKTVDGQAVFLSYYYPRNFDAQSQYPAFVFVHGGGWAEHKVFDDQNGRWQGDYLGYLARYFADRGMVCVSIDYRLARDRGQQEGYQLIDCYDDCAHAMGYILAHAAEHGVDTARVFLLGESAGGHLAGMLATAYDNHGFRFKTAFLVNPLVDIANDPYWITYIPGESGHPGLKELTLQERAEYLSPICHIKEDNCPVVLLHGQEDSVVAIRHLEAFYEKMTQMNLPCELHIIRGTNHAFLLAEFTDNLAACGIGISIIDDCLSGQI